MMVSARLTVLNGGMTLDTAKRVAIEAEERQDTVADGRETAPLEGSLGGTV